jgi:hypothetical protein
LIHDRVLITGELKRGFTPLTKPIPLPLVKGKGIKGMGLPSKNLKG